MENKQEQKNPKLSKEEQNVSSSDKSSLELNESELKDVAGGFATGTPIAATGTGWGGYDEYWYNVVQSGNHWEVEAKEVIPAMEGHLQINKHTKVYECGTEKQAIQEGKALVRPGESSQYRYQKEINPWKGQ